MITGMYQSVSVCVGGNSIGWLRKLSEFCVCKSRLETTRVKMNGAACWKADDGKLATKGPRYLLLLLLLLLERRSSRARADDVTLRQTMHRKNV